MKEPEWDVFSNPDPTKNTADFELYLPTHARVLAAMRILLANPKVNRFNTTEPPYAMRYRLANGVPSARRRDTFYLMRVSNCRKNFRLSPSSLGPVFA